MLHRSTTVLAPQGGSKAEDASARGFEPEPAAAREDRFRRLFEAAPCGYFTIDERTRSIVHSNRTLQRLLGYSAEELRQLPLRGLFADGPTGYDAALEVNRMARQGEPVGDFELQLAHKSGKPIWVSISVSPECDETGEVIETRSMVVDIRDRKRMEEGRRLLEEQLHRRQKLESLGVLAGGVAHDFNNLLAVILGNAEIVVEKLPEADPCREPLSEIRQASQRAAKLCRQMLAYSGKGRIDVESLGLSRLVAEIADLLRLTLPKTVELDLRLGRGLPPFSADAAQLQQVVMNLVANAGEAIENGVGLVKVRTGCAPAGEVFAAGASVSGELRPGCYLFLEVADDGSGMDRATIERIFDPFFTTKFVGRGLGLAAVSGIVRAHRGAVAVSSRPGEGTVIRTAFPVSGPEPEDSEQPEESSPAPREGQLILLADDEGPVLTMAGRMLEHLGFRVLSAGDGNEALELFRSHRSQISAVILDLVMPVMGGEEALAAIRELESEVPVIITSGYTHREIGSLIRADPRVGFLQKPYTLATLTETLRGLLTGAG